MNLNDNSANLSSLFKGIQGNNIFANIPSMNIGSDLTVKQPVSMPNFNNIQAAYSSAATIDSLFNSIQRTPSSSGTSSDMMAQLTSMMSQMGAMGNFLSPSTGSGATLNTGGSFDQSAQINSSMSQTNWMNNMTASSLGLGGFLSMPSMPTTNFVGLGEAPVSADSYMVSLGVAMGIIDPSAMPASASSTTQPTDSQAAALIKKMPVVSSAKTEQILNQPAEKQMMWGGVNQNVSLLSSDGSGAAILNAALPNPEDKAAFVNSLSSNIDKEVRLAGRGASKEVVAEVLANELFNLYEKKNPGATTPYGSGKTKENAAYKERILNALTNICTNNTEKLDANTLYDVSRVLPGISTKESNPTNAWNATMGGIGGLGMMGLGKNFSGGFDNSADPRITLLQDATNSLTASAKENLIKKNSLG